MTPLVLAAPLSGWATHLGEIPDPAFAQGLVGDGVAIDPTSSELRAPCDGVVVSVHRARHACTLRADCGAEILLHIGIDTVELHGEGFEVVVADGQRVRTGDLLIRFDMDLVSRRARSLHTPVLLTGGEGFAIVDRTLDREVTVGDFLLTIARTDTRESAVGPAQAVEQARPARQMQAEDTAVVAVRRVRLLLAHGLHARPAAAFVRRAAQHPGAVTVACGERSANGKSLTALMALDTRLGDELTITVEGPQSDATASELAALVAAGLGDETTADRTGAGRADRDESSAAPRAPDNNASAATAGSAAASTATSFATSFAPDKEVVLGGSAAAPGIAIGRAVRLASASTDEAARDGAGVAVERDRLAAALLDVRRDLEQTIAGARARGDAAAGDIFGAHLDLLDDPELRGAADREIAAGRSAAWAWQAALRELAAVLRGLGNPVLAERTSDIGDLERRSLARLTGQSGGRVPAELPDAAVLVADEILPSELIAIPAGRLAGLCTARGGSTSHVAILAAGMGVPAVFAIGDAALSIPDGAPVIVDGTRGSIAVFPGERTRETAQRAIADRAARRRTELARAHDRAETTDGTEIAVYANLANASDAALAAARGAEGCGLLRTELLFLDRQTAPSEDEQAASYQAIADALHGRPLVIRTLDAGGDKPMPYVPQAREDNPALGVRGVRLALRHPELLRTQLRAILRVAPAGICRIMVPMIASVGELRAVRAMLDEERGSLGAPPIELGAMVEVPAAAAMTDLLARDAEFFSIGTNDLSQYALAMDRGNGDIAASLDALHPGVLRLIASTVQGARPLGRPVSVCGGAAGDPYAVPILLGLGVRTLSVTPAQVPEIKALVRSLSLAHCTDVANAALGLDDGDAVRALVAHTWPVVAGPSAGPGNHDELTEPAEHLHAQSARPTRHAQSA